MELEPDIISLKEKLETLKTLRKIDLVYLNKSPNFRDIVKKEEMKRNGS